MSGIRILFYFLTLPLFIGCASAQPASGNNQLGKKDQKAFTEARSAYDLGQYPAAAKTLDELLGKYPSVADLHYLKALTYRQQGEYEKALAALESGKSNDASPSPTLYVELGQLQAQLGDFKASLEAYRTYQQAIGPAAKPGRREKAAELVRRAEIAVQIASRPVPFRAEPLPGSLNTSEHLEYFPSLSPDGKSMVFTRRVNRQNEDFYRSNLLEDGSWSEAVPLSGVNSEFNEGAQSISADGKFLVFTICERPENRGSCDLYFSRQVEGGEWTPARSIGRSINTEADESQPSISADGRLLFFSSNRPGGIGGKDLYVSGMLPDGSWSAPANLGKEINTPGNEQYPFWAADGKTLFFTSNLHPGLGGEDLFRTELTPQNTWEAPVNLGYPINTAQDETNLFVGLNGSTAYFSKRYVQSGTGVTDVDIYSFELPPALQPTPATYLEALVIDAKTKQALSATIRLSPLSQDAPPTFLSTGTDGKFLTVMPAGKDYALTVEQPGYLFYSDRFVLTGDLLPEEPYRLTIELQPVEEALVAGGTEADGSTAFRNVLFETGSATLLPVSGQELDVLVSLLQNNKSFNVEIAGHTDDVGEDVDNQRLSEARAVSVADYLSQQGIAPGRINTIGFGEDRPVAANDSPEGRAQNRRTTFRLIRP